MTLTTRQRLTAIPDLYALLDLFIQPGSLPPDPDKRRGTTSHARPPAVADVIDLRDTRLKAFADDEIGIRDLELDKVAGYRRLGVLPTLGLWVSMVCAELADLGEEVISCCPPHAHTVAGECAWLARHSIRIDELHPDFEDDIAWIHKDLENAVGAAIRAPYTPRCPWCRDVIEGQGETGIEWFRCKGCARNWVLAAEIRRLASTQPPMTLRQCADAINRPVGTLQRWAAENRFMPVGERRGAKVYDLDVVRRAAEAVNGRGRPRRGA